MSYRRLLRSNQAPPEEHGNAVAASARSWRCKLACVVALFTAVFIAVNIVRAVEPGVLWLVVHDLCVNNMKIRGKAAPCTTVNLPAGYVIIKDAKSNTQLLLVPTKKIRGIESPELLENGSVNYWQAAWQSRHLIADKLGRTIPRQDVAMAVNSRFGRTQEQLHIHIDCVRYDVQQALIRHQNEIGATWSDLKFHIIHRSFRAMRLEGNELTGHDPFKRLAHGDSRARADMGRETLAVVGATFSDGTEGFYLLSDRANRLTFNRGLGEELLDPLCSVLRTPS